MLKLDGKTLPYDKAFTLPDGRQFPAKWLRTSTLSEKNSVGITEVADPVTPSYNQKFYWSADKPKDIDELKVVWIEHQKKNAAALLSPTDWMVIRYTETTTVIPTKTKTYRTAVRTQCKKREDQITACSTTAKLAALIDEGKYDDIVLEAWPTE